jgi:hypothetical protein
MYQTKPPDKNDILPDTLKLSGVSGAYIGVCIGKSVSIYKQRRFFTSSIECRVLLSGTLSGSFLGVSLYTHPLGTTTRQNVVFVGWFCLAFLSARQEKLGIKNRPPCGEI